MSKQFCSSCGKEIPRGSKFCTNCGNAVGQASEQATPVNMQASTPNQQPQQQQSTPKPNNKMWVYIGIAAAVAIFAYVLLGKNSPEKVAEDFVHHFSAFELEDARKLLSKDGDSWIHDEIDWMIDEMKEYPEEYKRQISDAKKEGFVIKNVKITDKDVSKNNASITAEVTMENGDRDTVYVDLIKESGKWKVEDAD